MVTFRDKLRMSAVLAISSSEGRIAKTRRGISCLTQGDITGEDNNCYTSFGECGLDCDLQDTRHLLRLGNEFAVVTAFAEYAFRVSLLEILASDFVTRNMACDRENRNTTAVGIVQSIDQVQIPGATAPGTHRQAPGQMRFRTSSKCGGLFVPDVNPFDSFVGTDCVRDPVERISRKTVNPLHSCRYQSIDEELREILLSHCWHAR
jgi:hypothetical protein